MIKKLAGSGLAAAVLLAGSAVAAAPASAASYNGVCGQGYSVVNSAPIGSAGTVYLTYSSSTRKNCVVTVLSDQGTRVRAEAGLKKDTSTAWTTDAGDFAQYAGPVYLSAPGECVDWGGLIGTQWVVRTGTNCG
ncbi:spore-associated protein A [Actinorugispora endophytica]|uniref:Spore-associated protein A n=1 Tax=Actinorugispora endophytica TaxID=1605990 RepID=A0A4R6UWM4_9ACTN|nr:spore-associated protein A [Actinorugispora endophytica]TDQ51591.1 hypothetical protein EV190_11080 [Actinorugispora endophytica]